MTSTERTATTGRDRHPVREGFAAGTNFAAATLLLVVSVLGVFQGISALADDEIFVAGIDYVYKLDLTTWGWIVLILGLIGVVIGCGMYTGARGPGLVPWSSRACRSSSTFCGCPTTRCGRSC